MWDIQVWVLSLVEGGGRGTARGGEGSLSADSGNQTLRETPGRSTAQGTGLKPVHISLKRSREDLGTPPETPGAGRSMALREKSESAVLRQRVGFVPASSLPRLPCDRAVGKMHFPDPLMLGVAMRPGWPVAHGRSDSCRF